MNSLSQSKKKKRENGKTGTSSSVFKAFLTFFSILLIFRASPSHIFDSVLPYFRVSLTIFSNQSYHIFESVLPYFRVSLPIFSSQSYHIFESVLHIYLDKFYLTGACIQELECITGKRLTYFWHVDKKRCQHKI